MINCNSNNNNNNNNDNVFITRVFNQVSMDRYILENAYMWQTTNSEKNHNNNN